MLQPAQLIPYFPESLLDLSLPLFQCFLYFLADQMNQWALFHPELQWLRLIQLLQWIQSHQSFQSFRLDLLGLQNRMVQLIQRLLSDPILLCYRAFQHLLKLQLSLLVP